MPVCSRCHQSIDSQAVKCPHCKMVLKAFGHPGIPLHRSTGEEFLCESCTYQYDDTCTFPQRPHATTCILYENYFDRPVAEASPISNRSNGGLGGLKLWMQRNKGLLFLLALIILSFSIAFFR